MKYLFYIGITFVLLGAMLIFSVVLGIAKSKSTYVIMHVASINDAIGSTLMLLGASLIVCSFGMWMICAKILFLIGLIYIANPITSYLIAKILYFYSHNDPSEKNSNK